MLKSQIYAHTSLGEALYGSKVNKPWFDYRRASKTTYISLGIPEDNLFPFYNTVKNYGDDNDLYVNNRGVLLTPEIQMAYSYDMEKKGHRSIYNNDLRNIILVE